MDALIEDAAIRGDLKQLELILKHDQWALERIHLGSLVHTPLHIAAFRDNDGSFVDEILKKCPSLALVLDQRRWSPLRLAVLRRHMGIVKALLKEAPEMCAVIDDDGYNPFHLAAIKGWKEGLAELIKVRPHVAFEVTSNGESILHLCVKHNNQDCLQWLFKIFTDDEFIIETFTTDPDDEFIIETFTTDPKFIIDAFTDHEFINAKDKAGNNILHQAVRSKKIEIIRLLIIDPNIKIKMCGVINDDGYNPLHLAAIMNWKEGLIEMCGVTSNGEELAEPIIDQPHVDNFESNGEELAELIIDQPHVDNFEVTSNGEELAEKDQRRHVAFEVTSNGESILHLCMKHNKEDCLEWLLDTFNDSEFINAKDNAGNNILHHAVRSKKIKIIKQLIIDPNMKVKMCGVINDDGYNPLHLAAIMGWKEGLTEMCGVTNHRHVAFEVTSNGESILHLCVKHNNQKCLEWLLETFTDYEFINAKDNAGNNILDHAVRSNKFEIIGCIIDPNIEPNMKVKFDINATNAMGLSPLDIILQRQDNTYEDRILKHNLTQVGAERKFYRNIDWLMIKRRDTLMVVTSLFATMTFAAVRNPTGGVMKNTQAGLTDLHKFYLLLNSLAFFSSLSTILLLISRLPHALSKFVWEMQLLSMWMTIWSAGFSYLYAIDSMTPQKDRAYMKKTLILPFGLWIFILTALYHLRKVIIKFFF